MPYKDPERKRQWERDHREQRNARRRIQAARVGHPSLPKPVPDPVSAQKPTNAWKVLQTIGGFALVVGIALLAAWDGIGAAGSGCGTPNTPHKP